MSDLRQPTRFRYKTVCDVPECGARATFSYALPNGKMQGLCARHLEAKRKKAWAKAGLPKKRKKTRRL